MLTRATPLQLATSRFRAADLIIESGLAAVRITLGAPKFPLGYTLAGEVPELAPSPGIFRLPWERFQPAYLRQLERLDGSTIARQLRDIAESVSAPGCVLLCFEDVTKGELCHRRMFAEWWKQKTGAGVPELD